MGGFGDLRKGEQAQANGLPWVRCDGGSISAVEARLRIQKPTYPPFGELYRCFWLCSPTCHPSAVPCPPAGIRRASFTTTTAPSHAPDAPHRTEDGSSRWSRQSKPVLHAIGGKLQSTHSVAWTSSTKASFQIFCSRAVHTLTIFPTISTRTNGATTASTGRPAALKDCS